MFASMKIPNDAFRRQDETPDERFYSVPRLVTHIDDGAIAAVKALYREFFTPNGSILDFMSSWVSHLPEEAYYERVFGLGMNQTELEANPRLTEYRVQNLNTNPILPFDDKVFDGAACCVSIDYLTRPVEVLKEVHRVLKSEATLVITFSNRCFPTKAVAAWLYSSDEDHLKLVELFLKEAAEWKSIELLDRSPKTGDPLYAVAARKAK
jgi:SAM-dependent methyltransferase